MSTEKAKCNWDLQGKAFIEQDAVKESFVKNVMGIHRKSEADAESIYNREVTYLKKALSESAALAECTALSLYSAFMEVSINGISIQPGSKSEAFMEARNQKTKVNGQETWVKIATLRISAYGELNMRIASGQILCMMNPIVLYDGDHFQPRTNDHGHLIVEYAPKIPRQKDAKIFGCYVEVVLPNGLYDYKWLLDEDIERLANYSIPKSGENRKANALYTANGGQIDPGFLEAKTIKHAFRSKTKLKVGDSVAFEGDDDEPKHDQAPFESAPVNNATHQGTAPAQPAETVTVEDDDEGVF